MYLNLFRCSDALYSLLYFTGIKHSNNYTLVVLEIRNDKSDVLKCQYYS